MRYEGRYAVRYADRYAGRYARSLWGALCALVMGDYEGRYAGI
jgi:hypothetical protein